MHEFDIINQFFAAPTLHRAEVRCGIGDDAAIVTIPPNQELIITTDTLVSGIHFSSSTPPFDIGYKSLAVNLSDLAAMGATPAWITLALTLNRAEESWLKEFSRGLLTLANRYTIQLIGGDLTQGPLSITITAFGFAPTHQALRRSAAKPDDLIYVTGTLGDAGFALKEFNQANDYFITRLNRPEPCIEIGESLRNLAHAAIDISDGLAADLGHILEQSKVGAIVYVDKLPLSTTLLAHTSHKEAIHLALTAGDDYELCFTVPKSQKTLLEKKFMAQTRPVTCIGHITSQPGLSLCYQDGRKYHGTTAGYQHF